MLRLIKSEKNTSTISKRYGPNSPVGFMMLDSMEEAVHRANNAKHGWSGAINVGLSLMSHYKRKEWLGRDDYDPKNPEKFIYEPWIEGVKAVQYTLDKTRDQEIVASAMRRRRRYEEDGSEASADRFLAGSPDYMESIHKEINDGSQFISLLMTPCHDKNTKGTTIFAQSAAIIANIDQLERQNIQVELYAYWRFGCCYPNKKASVDILMPVKRLGEPLNIEAVLSLLSPWWFRITIQQLALDFVPEFGHPCSHLGWAEDLRENVRDHIPPQTIDIPRASTMESIGKMFHDFSKVLTKGDGREDVRDLN